MLALWLLALSPSVAALPQAFLLQNSGWMEPFYADPQSALKPLVAAVVQAAAPPGEDLYIAAFSQATDFNPSPQLVYPDPRYATPKQAIDSIGLAHKNPAGALADTDFQEAVSRIILRQFRGRPGIVWIFTNNRNSPNNDLDTARRNQEFYALLHNQASIHRTLVYPLSMPVRGKLYPKAQGLMVYALAYGEAAEVELRALVARPALAAVLTAPPARLKPLDRESVRLLPKPIPDAPGVDLHQDRDGKTTVIEVDAGGQKLNLNIPAELENLFYPYQIEAARVSARFVSGGKAYPLTVTPAEVATLPPGARQRVVVGFPIPRAQIPAPWSLAHIGQFGTQLILPGSIEIALDNQHLALSPAFIKTLRDNFPNDPISQVFTPPQEARASSVSIPLSIRINYPVSPVIGLILLAFLVFGALAWVAHELTRPRPVPISIDGERHKPMLKLWQTLPVKTPQGHIVGEVRRGLLRAKIVRVVEGHRVELISPT